MPILIVIAILILLVLIGCLDLRCAVKKAAGRDNQAARKEVCAEIALEDGARDDRERAILDRALAVEARPNAVGTGRQTGVAEAMRLEAQLFRFAPRAIIMMEYEQRMNRLRVG